jgi:hypothetical protein
VRAKEEPAELMSAGAATNATGGARGFRRLRQVLQLQPRVRGLRDNEGRAPTASAFVSAFECSWRSRSGRSSSI